MMWESNYPMELTAGGPACFKLGAQHKKLGTDVEPESGPVSQ